MSLPGLELLKMQDPAAAQQLVALFRRMAAAVDADRWAAEQLPVLLRAGGGSALLGALVERIRYEAPDHEVWAVRWNGDLAGGTASFHALAGNGALLPAPHQVSRTVLAEMAADGEAVWSSDPAIDQRFAGAESIVATGLRAIGAIPLGPSGAVYLACAGIPRRLGTAARAKIEALCRIASAIVDAPVAPHAPDAEPVPGLVGTTAAMRELYAAIRAFAGVPWPALILGETGTGKEAVARALHLISPRASAPFVAVNCGTIPEELAESTLFGHERGAFTGADRRREGLVERAEGGTLFLDELGELPPRIQVKLLRLLQEGTFERVGGDRELRFNGRIVAATLRPVDRGEDGFRRDLYHRLGACVIQVPPLRDRAEDIPALARILLERALAEIPGAPPMSLSPLALHSLSLRPWPGNVRELENALKRAIARTLPTRRLEISPGDLAGSVEPSTEVPRALATRSPAPSEPPPLAGIHSTLLLPATEEFQRAMVRDALRATGGNRKAAAERLGVTKQWLHRLLARWGGEA